MKKKYIFVRFKILPAFLLAIILISIGHSCSSDGVIEDEKGGMVIRNKDFKYKIAGNGRNLCFIDNATGVDYLNTAKPSYCAYTTIDGKEFPVSSVSLKGNLIKLVFSDTGVKADILVTKAKNSVILEVVDVKGAPQSLTFINVPLTLDGLPDEPFAACVLSLNLYTHVRELPALQSNLWATCYQRFRMKGSKIALIGVPMKNILPAIREVMKNAEEIPHSTAGGAWAQLSKEGHGSYLTNYGSLNEGTIDEWIEMCASVGFNQIDNHGGRQDFFKFGSFELNPEKWPDRWNHFKRINKRLHDAGISSIFHTYAFFIDKSSRYVTPIPSEDLGYFNSYTVTAPIGPEDDEIAVKEPTNNVSATTGWNFPNSNTLRIGHELIEFSGVTNSPPFKFTGCKRAVNGTKASAYKVGEIAYHLKEQFNRFVPGPETGLFNEIAHHTAEIVNECNFDGIYLDAIDGSDILAGQENYWYYSSKFLFEIAKYLKPPVGMEMSSMVHHWWHYRSRWQAWDRPVRGYKRFIDIHSASIKSDEYEHGYWRGNTTQINKLAPLENGGLLLPLHLGWWGHQNWDPPQMEPTFSDDIEYLGCKMIGNNAGLSIIGDNDKKTMDKNPSFSRWNAIIKQYEELRQKNYFGEDVKKLLRQPGKEFTLFKEENGSWNFKPVAFQKHKVAGINHPSARWTVNNEFGSQPVRLRIEPLLAVKSYNDRGNVVLADFSGYETFSNKGKADGVSGDIISSIEKEGRSEVGAIFSAFSSGASPREGSWISLEKNFEPWLNLSNNKALGVWIKGDGNGELLNIRLESPEQFSAGARGDHFVKIDFTGWKYFELVEIESTEFSNYIWPSLEISPNSLVDDFFVYKSYMLNIQFQRVDKLQLWYNNLPAGKKVSTILGPIKALPVVLNTITNPSIMIGGEKITFPVRMDSGMYLEFRPATDCKLYGPKGELLGEIVPEGAVPDLANGDNEVSFSCNGPKGIETRVQVTLISEGTPLVKK
jgi:hypothetical protein